MNIKEIYTTETLHLKAQALFLEERNKKRLDGWFIVKEIARECDQKFSNLPSQIKAARTLIEIVTQLPLSISDHAIFAGTQNDAFARSYALINPSFKVDSFTGYCDPTAVFDDITPDENFSRERINCLRTYTKGTAYVKALDKVYENAGDSTSEAIFFIEQVTGHLIPDFRFVLAHGVESLISELSENSHSVSDPLKKANFDAMKISLSSVTILAERYADCARNMQDVADEKRKRELLLMENTLLRISKKGARNLFEAIQLSFLLWQAMCLEQCPNPFAFSVGNADRIFEPYRAMDNLDREMSTALFKHFLVFFNVADRSWAISQNILIGGKSNEGMDLTNESSYALLDAFFDMNLPQPILSVKLHSKTPDSLYKALGRFFFTPGCLTPSLFNDDSLFEVLLRSGVETDDLEDYAVAGCQEPLIMGKDNGNTTNSWLNLAKILELTLSGGISTITGKKIGLDYHSLGLCETDAKGVLAQIRTAFYNHVEFFVDKMVDSANEASKAISLLPVPFLSSFTGGAESGIDIRDTHNQGTKYNGSGCLIHGLSIIADSFIAIDTLLMERPHDSERLIYALKNNFKDNDNLHQYLLMCPKYGNNIDTVDEEARSIVLKISELIVSKKNYLDNPFRPDWSSPSTHLLYGYWVGATPDGRKSREMLGYGIDPLYGESQSGLGFRLISNMRLPFDRMNGGYASHFGITPDHFTGSCFEDKGMEFRNKVITPLFFNASNTNFAPFYLYVNVTTPETLLNVIENPKKYAPSGVYIMRIHGTFVNFLDLSPEIQTDIIKRLDLKSTFV